jgi:AraC family transcriptional regulator
MTLHKSQLAFKQRATGKREEVLSHARVHATSKTFGWTGLYAEVGENDGWSVDDLVPAGHYVAISRDVQDFHFKALTGGVWQDVVIPPRHLWIQPAGEPFSFRVATTARWCGVIIDPARLAMLMGNAGAQPAVEAAIGLEDAVLTPLMEAVCAEVLRGGTSGARFADAMLVALGTQLVRLFGQAQKQHKGGMTGRTLRLITDFVEAHLGGDIHVEQLAQIARLSEAHFSRAFKQTTGQSPHGFVVRRRLERGKRLVADTRDSIADIAHTCGFADQAHFARSFQQAFGSSPSALRKAFS